MHIVTIEEMRELEERAGREYGLTSPILMETAGRSAAELLAGEIEQVNGQEFLLLIGPGNNGGDGLVIARHLKDWGGADAAGRCCDPGRAPGHRAGAFAAR